MKLGRSILISIAGSLLFALLMFGGARVFGLEVPLFGKTMALATACSFLLNFALAEILVLRRIRHIRNLISSFRGPDDIQQDSNRPGSLIGTLEFEVKNLLSARRSEIEQLKKLETYRKEYLGNVAHELKTPVFNIQGYIATLLDGGIDDETIRKPFLEKAEANLERMTMLLQDLDTINRLETGVLELNPQVFSISDLATEVIESLELQANAKKITLRVQDPAADYMVMADKFRIRQVLNNLVLNSIKYGRESGTTRIRVKDLEEKVMVEIADNGNGIAENDLPRIFERFYRGDKSRSRNEGGTGLGLAIVKHILEAHEENISVMSTAGSGSVFSFTLKKA